MGMERKRCAKPALAPGQRLHNNCRMNEHKQGKTPRILKETTQLIRLRYLLVLCLALLCIALSSPAQAEEPAEAFNGYYDIVITLVDRGTGENLPLARIPQYTPLFVVPSEDPRHKGYGTTTYEGQEGFVLLRNLKDLPRDRADDRAGLLMYARDVRVVRELGLHGAKVLRRLGPETPFVVLGRNQYMVKVEVDGLVGYTYGGKLEELGPDTPHEPLLVYSLREQALRSHPLSGAAAVQNLKAGQLLSVLAYNRGYYKVRVQDLEGYVLKENTGSINENTQDRMLVYSLHEAALYQGPGEGQRTEQRLVPGHLYEVTAQAGEYLRLRENDLFVHAAEVQTLLMRAFTKPRLASVDAETPLAPLPEVLPDETLVLKPQTLYAFHAASGSWWYYDDGETQGFVRAKDLRALPEKSLAMNRTWARYLGEETQLLGGAAQQAVARDEVLMLSQMWGDDWFSTSQGAFVHRSKLDLLASDAPLTPHTVAATEGLVLRSLPDEALGQTLFNLEAGEALAVTGFANQYLLVNARGKAGYVLGRTLKTHETRFLPDEQPRPVEILVNKSNFMVSVYLLDGDGRRVGEALRSGITALGKRSTPTPSGRYLLGEKQRWVRFPNTVAPHSVTYLRGRYLHGIPTEGRDESTVTDWGISELGTFATGGCVRMPFDLANWIYFNCPSYVTVMEVVNGIE